MPFAVIELTGKQFKVSPGDTFTVTGHLGDAGASVKPVSVLLYQDADLQLGRPSLDIPVNLEIVSTKRGPKLEIATFKSKSRYRKHTGYRGEQTVLKVTSIGKKV